MCRCGIWANRSGAFWSRLFLWIPPCSHFVLTQRSAQIFIVVYTAAIWPQRFLEYILLSLFNPVFIDLDAILDGVFDEAFLQARLRSGISNSRYDVLEFTHFRNCSLDPGP